MYAIEKALFEVWKRLASRLGSFQLRGRGVFALAFFSVLAGCGGMDGERSPTAPTSININVLVDADVRGDGVTDDEPALQAALDYAAKMGGGVVYLPAGVYAISRPLVVRSRVHLMGDGYGKTIVRSQVVSLGKTVDGTGIWSAIALLSADRASVTNLTVDLATASTSSNGVALLPAGANFDGAPSTNCKISNVEVLGGGNFHAYMIWNMRGQSIEITNNLVDGGIQDPVESYQEGIESYGGKDVLIGWNTVRNIGNTALNFGSAGFANTGIDNLVVIGNSVSNVGRGLNLGTWLDVAGPQNIANVRIEENNFEGLWNKGMFIPVQAGTRIDGLRIYRNKIEAVGNASSIGAIGIHFEGAGASHVAAAAASKTEITENLIGGIRGTNSFGLLINRYPDVVVSGNVIDRIDNGGIQAFGSTGLIVDNNLISDVGLISVGTYGPQSGTQLRGNMIVNWGLSAAVTSVLIDDAVAGEIRNNEFQHEHVDGRVVTVGRAASNVVVFGNTVTSTALLSSLASSKVNPFVNLGGQSNLGTFFAKPELLVMEIDHPLVTPTSQIIVEQLAGPVLAFAVVQRAGVIQFTFESVPTGLERFRYEIDP
jgi:hypothetical protein